MKEGVVLEDTRRTARRVGTCYHCGAPVSGAPVDFDGKPFCCNGCRSVYEILSRHQLCEYYTLESAPGRASSLRQSRRFGYLDDPALASTLVERFSPAIAVVRFSIPQMHCSSCIWLLENLPRLDRGILSGRTEFLKKRLTIRFDPQETSLRRIVELLASVGYEPELNLGTAFRAHDENVNRPLFLRLGVAAFCTGNIMLFSLPEYLSSGTASEESRLFFHYLNFLLSIPVVFYSAGIYFRSALQGLRKHMINIDVPLALGIALLFVRSAADIAAASGPGYFDSLTGLVFLLLIGRVFQIKTYEHLNFERRYESYLPLAVTVRSPGGERPVPVAALRPGDRVILRNQEVLPADGVLMSEHAGVDYSFVSGETAPVPQNQGALLHAGGRNVGAAVEIELVREVSQSSLAQIWDSWPRATTSKSRLLTLGNTAGKYFTLATLAVSMLTAAGWLMVEPAKALDAVTAVLIVACPCALSLAAPFAFGTAMRIFGKRRFFLKNASVVESLARVDTVVLDKTGTLTSMKMASVRFVGTPLSVRDRAVIGAVVSSSAHPLSRAMNDLVRESERYAVSGFEEVEGEGAAGVVDGVTVRIGSAHFTGGAIPAGSETAGTRVFVSFDGTSRGWFEFDASYRPGIANVLREIGDGRMLNVLSGDGPAERERLLALYDRFGEVLFRQSPADKREYVRSMQERGEGVAMLGDGLNDAAALRQSDVGIAVTEDASTFTPACDGILEASAFPLLGRLFMFPRTTMRVVYLCIGVSILYNVVGAWFAIRAELSPLLAAILMPASSITVVALASGLTQFFARRRGLL